MRQPGWPLVFHRPEVNVLHASDEQLRVGRVVEAREAALDQPGLFVEALDAEVRQLEDVHERLELDVAGVVAVKNEPDQLQVFVFFAQKRWRHHLDKLEIRSSARITSNLIIQKQSQQQY